MDRYLLLRADGSAEMIDIPEECWLGHVYDLIGCDCIEIVQTFYKDVVLVIDESGKCKDGWEARINEVASKLYPGSIVGDVIVGDAVLAVRIGYDLYPLSTHDVFDILKYLPDIKLKTYFG